MVVWYIGSCRVCAINSTLPSTEDTNPVLLISSSVVDCARCGSSNSGDLGRSFTSLARMLNQSAVVEPVEAFDVWLRTGKPSCWRHGGAHPRGPSTMKVNTHKPQSQNMAVPFRLKSMPCASIDLVGQDLRNNSPSFLSGSPCENIPSTQIPT